MIRSLTQRLETLATALAAVCLLAPMLVGSALFVASSI